MPPFFAVWQSGACLLDSGPLCPKLGPGGSPPTPPPYPWISAPTQATTAPCNFPGGCEAMEAAVDEESRDLAINTSASSFPTFLSLFLLLLSSAKQASFFLARQRLAFDFGRPFFNNYNSQSSSFRRSF